MNTSATTLQQIRPLLPIRLLNGCGALLEKARIPFGGAPAVSITAYWPHWDVARAIALRADGTAGYVLDAYGGLHPFTVNVQMRQPTGLSRYRMPGNPRTTLYRRAASERYQRAAKSAGCGPGASMSPDVGSDDAIATYSRR